MDLPDRAQARQAAHADSCRALRSMLGMKLCIRMLRHRTPGRRAGFNAAASGLCISAVAPMAGPPIAASNVLIAGHARSRSLVVVTGHLAELDRVAGLRRAARLAWTG